MRTLQGISTDWGDGAQCLSLLPDESRTFYWIAVYESTSGTWQVKKRVGKRKFGLDQWTQACQIIGQNLSRAFNLPYIKPIEDGFKGVRDSDAPRFEKPKCEPKSCKLKSQRANLSMNTRIYAESPISGCEIPVGMAYHTKSGKWLPKLRNGVGEYQNIKGQSAVETFDECERIIKLAYLKRVESDLRAKIGRCLTGGCDRSV